MVRDLMGNSLQKDDILAYGTGFGSMTAAKVVSVSSSLDPTAPPVPVITLEFTMKVAVDPNTPLQAVLVHRPAPSIAD